MRGRKPNPERLRLLGSVSATERMAIGGTEPPECPDWLDEEAKKEWARIVPPLAAKCLLTPVDAATLAAYCQAYSSYKAAELTVRQEGRTMENAKGEIKLHPLARYSLQLLAEIRRLGAEYGLSPASRTRINAPPPRNEEGDDFEAFTNGASS